jgi:hypothetical protein
MARMTTNRPARKVAASSVGSALSVLAVWALAEFGGIEMPAGVESALVLLVTFLVGYYVPPSPHDQVEPEQAEA